MPADNVLSVVRRVSTYVDTSGAVPPRAIQMVPRMGGGVYTVADDDPESAAGILQGRISLGIIAAFILGAVGFYVWTNGIQGGG
jgi:hypothetical protein